jgi:type IV pilus assembly protein PilA
MRARLFSFPSLVRLMRLGSLLPLAVPVVCSAGCGAPKAPAAAFDAPMRAAGPAGKAGVARADADAPSGPRRGATRALKKVWPFEDPKVVVYADVEGLMRTTLMTEVKRSVLGMIGLWATASQALCVDETLANVKEVAVGSDGDASLVVLRVDPTSTKWISACFKAAMPEARPTTMRGAVEAWDGHGIGALTADGLLLSGPKELVERALRGSGSGASLATVTLADGEYVAWLARLFDNASPITGSLVATDARFRIGGEAEVPSDDVAAQLESELTPDALTKMLPATSPKPEEAALFARLANAFQVKRQGRHIAIAFELREPPAQQARDLGAAAALGVYGVRRYISNAKQAEARNAVGQLAKDVVADWEVERPDGKPREKRKLVSYGPVPKTVPKGVKYQTSEADWKPWAALGFSMTVPHYFQYEIKAAADGESAEVIARGDLNGDGKTSQFKLLIKVDRKTSTLRIAPSISETDPEE